MIQQDPFSGALFLFRSRSGDFIKVLWRDGDGFAIFAKRLEIGTFRFPDDVRFVNGEYAPVEIDKRELAMLLEGIDTGTVRRLKRYRRESRDQQANPNPKSAGGEVNLRQNAQAEPFEKAGMKHNRAI